MISTVVNILSVKEDIQITVIMNVLNIRNIDVLEEIDHLVPVMDVKSIIIADMTSIDIYLLMLNMNIDYH